MQLSVVGFGTAQCRCCRERQAVETLARGFELGVNWIHTAPDYGAIDPWIAEAIDQSGREVMVLSAGRRGCRISAAFFENTCHVYRTARLALYGLSGIEDLEWHGENVWGAGGMVEYLQARKAEGRLGGIYCSTHGPADYVARLIETGVFDAIMLAWNPLGFHQQSQPGAGRRRARVRGSRASIASGSFRSPPSAASACSIMKPFAGGLLCQGKALSAARLVSPPPGTAGRRPRTCCG